MQRCCCKDGDPQLCKGWEHKCVCATNPKKCRYEDWDPAGAHSMPVAIPPHECSCHFDPKECRLRDNSGPYTSSIKPSEIPPHQCVCGGCRAH